MTTLISWRASCDEYIDVDVFIPDPDVEGAEWCFMITKEKSTGLITVGNVRYAKTPTADFDDAVTDPQLSVMSALAESMPDALKMLEEQKP